MQLLAGTDAGTGVRGRVGVWGGDSAAGSGGGETRDTHTHTHTGTHTVHADVAPTL